MLIYLLQTTASDPDGNSLEYSIQEYDSGNLPFTISTDGNISVKPDSDEIDYEALPSKIYNNITIIVTDGQLSNSAVFSIEILNENEPCYFDSNSFASTIPEDSSIGTIIEIVTVTDDDNKGYYAIPQQLTYTIENSDSSLFEINSVTGDIIVNGVLDYEMKDIYNLVVNVTDGEFIDTATVTINISDVADTTITSVNGINLSPDGSAGNIVITGTDFGKIDASDVVVCLN